MTIEKDRPRTARWTNYEPFTFADGVRYAWVTYEAVMPDGDRRCVAVSERNAALDYLGVAR